MDSKSYWDEMGEEEAVLEAFGFDLSVHADGTRKRPLLWEDKTPKALEVTGGRRGGAVRGYPNALR